MFSQHSVEELARRPDLNLFQHLVDELEQQLQVRPYHWTSVLDLIKVLVSEQTPVARFQTVVESLQPEEWRLLEQHVIAHGVAVTCSAMECPHTFRHVLELCGFILCLKNVNSFLVHSSNLAEKIKSVLNL